MTTGLDETACLANAFNETAVATPGTAFRCAPGSSGVLCATCDEGMYFKGKKCVSCEVEVASSGMATALALVFVGVAVYVGHRVFMRKYAGELLRTLHRVRRKMKARAKKEPVKPADLAAGDV